MFKNRKRKGFTLIELVIVIAIIGILAAIAIPRFTSSTQKARNAKIEANARSIASALSTDYAVKGEWIKATAENQTKIKKEAGLNDTEAAKFEIVSPTNAGVLTNNKITIKYTGTDYDTSVEGSIGTGTSGAFLFNL